MDNQVVIVAGETGSGKTTQIPKICLELGRDVGEIAAAGPIQVAAQPVFIAEGYGGQAGPKLAEIRVGCPGHCAHQGSETGASNPRRACASGERSGCTAMLARSGSPMAALLMWEDPTITAGAAPLWISVSRFAFAVLGIVAPV